MPKTMSFSRFRMELDETLSDAARGQTYFLVEESAAPIVLTSARKYARMEEELILHRAIAAGKADIAAGRLYTHEQVVADLNRHMARWKSNGHMKPPAGSRKSRTISPKTRRNGRKTSSPV
jgi:predicted transcriptional regulator